jgi:DNA invertase Pin-like site-specific DNA recombinase
VRPVKNWVIKFNASISVAMFDYSIDTTSPTGKLIFHIFGSLAEFERGLIRERVKAGLEVAKKCGKKFGRPDALDDKAK